MSTSARGGRRPASCALAPAPAVGVALAGYGSQPALPSQATTSCGVSGAGNPTESSTMSQGTVTPSPLLSLTGVVVPIPALPTTIGLTAVLEVTDGTDLDLFLLD